MLGGAYVTVGRKRDHSTEEKSGVVTMMALSGIDEDEARGGG